MVGAAGTVAYQCREGAENAVSAYYLYRDETGVYFAPEACFARTEVTDGATVTGEDYPGQITFAVKQGAASFSVICRDGNGEALSTAEYKLEEVADYQTFPMPDGAAWAEIVCYTADGMETERLIVTPEDPGVVGCCDGEGQILASRSLRFVWPE